MKIGVVGEKIWRKPGFGFPPGWNPENRRYLAAATELTSIVSPLASPFTVAFAAANLRPVINGPAEQVIPVKVDSDKVMRANDCNGAG